MSGSPLDPCAAPGASDLVALARRRLADELTLLPAWKTPAFWWRMRTRDTARTVSLGALAHFVRRAAAADDAPAVRELFTLLIERTERLNLRWAARTVERTPALHGDVAEAARDDLMQELAMYLWERMRHGGEQWEIFFYRALEFAQRHVASAYMEKRGLWPRAGVRQPRQVLAHLVESLSSYTATDGAGGEEELSADATPFASVELTDLRLLVLDLPLPQRIAVVLRFWQDASEDEIALALGGVTTRTVRNHLRRAYDLLRAAYEGPEVTT